MKNLIPQKIIHVVVQKRRHHNIGYVVTAEEVVQRTINTLTNMDSSFVVKAANNSIYAVCIDKEPNLVVKIHQSGRIRMSPSLVRVRTTQKDRKIIRKLLLEFKNKKLS